MTTTVLITYRARLDHIEAARRELATLVATVLAKEPDCGGITMLQGLAALAADAAPEAQVFIEWMLAQIQQDAVTNQTQVPARASGA